MRINLMGYEVEIKAKQPLISKYNNIRDTKAVINTIICLMWDAAQLASKRANEQNTNGNKDGAVVYETYKKLMEKYASQASDEYDNL